MRSNNILNYLILGNNLSLSYNSHKAEYYELNNEVNSLLKLYQVLRTPDSFNSSFKVQIPFVPNGIDLGSNSKEVVRELGRAKYIINKNIGKNHSVMFFRHNVNSINILSQFHFYNDSMVYLKITFDYLEAVKEARNSIYNSLQSKYDLIINPNSDNLFSDVNRNYLRIFDNGQVNVQYFCMKEDIFKELRSKLKLGMAKSDNSNQSIIDLI
jgi:hypothetical protein